MSTTDICGNCEGIDPATCLVCGPAPDTLQAERDGRLRGIQERVEGVTLGPWFHEPRGGQNQNGDYSGMCIYDGHGEYLVHDVSDADGAFIASAPSDVAWLLAEVVRLQARLDAYEP